jgi:phage repressor protein C with HTH and peptisase S24 domain
MALKDRIQELVNAGHKKAHLAKAAGKSPASVTHWLNGETKEIKSDSAAGLQALTGFNAVWISTGKGPKKVDQEDQKRSLINLKDNPDYPSIRRVKFKLSAGASGFGVDYVDEDSAPIVFQRKWFEGNGYIPDKLLAADVANGSMEPGLYHGDTVVVNTADTIVKDGVVYAMNYEGELVIKRLVRDAGQWWLSSDNPDQRRYPRKVCTENVFCIGRVVHKQSERI